MTPSRPLKYDLGDHQAESLALRLLALAQAYLPDHHEDGFTSAERALALARELGEPAFEQEILHTVAHVYNRAGRNEDALRLCHDGLGLARDVGVQAAVADWLGISGDAYYGLGRYHEAVETLRSALPIFRDHFMRRHHGLCLLKIGYAYQAMGDYQTAISDLKQSLRIFDQVQLGHFAERAREALDTCLNSKRTASDEPPRA
jgi:tetratricopeptide (TPR) repeat protein